MNAPDGSEADSFAITLIRFTSAEQFYLALTGERAADLLADIRNFTSVEPLLQVNESIFEWPEAKLV